jgi:hypothetical protein
MAPSSAESDVVRSGRQQFCVTEGLAAADRLEIFIMRKNDIPIDGSLQELSPAEQFEVLVPLARILVHLGLVRGLTVEKFDEVAEQIIATGRGGASQ